MAPEYNWDRRLSNEAFRRFCEEIDLGRNDVCTKKLFTCCKCEVPFTPNDCVQLGIRTEHCEGLK